MNLAHTSANCGWQTYRDTIGFVSSKGYMEEIQAVQIAVLIAQVTPVTQMGVHGCFSVHLYDYVCSAPTLHMAPV